MKLTQEVKDAIARVIELWAEQTLPGKPAVYANAAYFTLERELQKITDQIHED